MSLSLSPLSPDWVNAIKEGDETEVNRLFEEGRMSINYRYGISNPIHLAVKSGSCSMVENILRRGASPNQLDAWFRTPLVYAASCSCLSLLERCDHLAVIELLVKKGANINGGDRAGCTPLMYAAENNRLCAMETLLRNGAPIDLQDRENGSTALMHAAAAGNLACATALLNNGARTDIATTGSCGQAALTIAVIRNHPSVVSLLVERGAEVDKVDNKGRSALFCAAREGFLSSAIILTKGGAKMDLGDENGVTPLMAAASASHPQLVTLFLSQGASVDGPVDKLGRTALDHAEGNPEIYQQLTEAYRREVQGVTSLLTRLPAFQERTNERGATEYVALSKTVRKENGQTENVTERQFPVGIPQLIAEYVYK